MKSPPSVVKGRVSGEMMRQLIEFSAVCVYFARRGNAHTIDFGGPDRSARRNVVAKQGLRARIKFVLSCTATRGGSHTSASFLHLSPPSENW